MRVSVVGDSDFCLGFKLAGVQATYEMAADAFPSKADDIVDEESGVLVVAGEHLAALPERRRLQLQNLVDPVVIPVAAESEDADLRNKIKQAIGVDLWA